MDKEYYCLQCGEKCKVLTDHMLGGHVSLCHGTGVCYEDDKGNVIEENEDLRYDRNWNGPYGL